MSTALDFLKGALRRINAYQSGEQLAPQDAQDALEYLNDLLESWSTDKLQVFGTNEYVFQWIVGQNQYTIGNPKCTDIGEPAFIGALIGGTNTITGITNMPADIVAGTSLMGTGAGSTLTDTANVIPTGTYVTAVGTTTITMSANASATPANGNPQVTYTIPGNFGIPRPLRITGGFTRNSELDFTFDVAATQAEYNSILLKTQPGPWPTLAWYNPQMPYGILHVYQTPGQGSELHLFTDTILQNLSLDQTVIMPQGYARALKWCLAKEMWPEYWGNSPLPASIAKQADESLKVIMALNARPAERATYDRMLLGSRADAGWITNGGFR